MTYFPLEYVPKEKVEALHHENDYIDIRSEPEPEDFNEQNDR